MYLSLLFVVNSCTVKGTFLAWSVQAMPLIFSTFLCFCFVEYSCVVFQGGENLEIGCHLAF